MKNRLWIIWSIILYLIYILPFPGMTTQTMLCKSALIWLIGLIGTYVLLKDYILYQNGLEASHWLFQYAGSIIFVTIAPIVALAIGLWPLEARPTVEMIVVEGFLYALVIGFFEEFLFRGLIQQSLMKKYKDIDCVLISAFLFGLAHMPGMWYAPMVIICTRTLWNMALGIYFASLYQKSHNLMLVSIIHMLVDCSTIVFLFSKENGYPIKVGVAILCIFYMVSAYGLSLMQDVSTPR